ncbi:hypothetical protein D082_22770 [Synechocystis sp. PCC 6714]|nr:hypothetical protein D082_22770 [Synechocystis sp. PCC 6714]
MTASCLRQGRRDKPDQLRYRSATGCEMSIINGGKIIQSPQTRESLG